MWNVSLVFNQLDIKLVYETVVPKDRLKMTGFMLCASHTGKQTYVCVPRITNC